MTYNKINRIEIYILQIQSPESRDFDHVSLYANENEIKGDIIDIIVSHIDDCINDENLTEIELAVSLEDLSLKELQELWDEHNGDEWSFTHSTTTIKIPCSEVCNEGVLGCEPNQDIACALVL